MSALSCRRGEVPSPRLEVEPPATTPSTAEAFAALDSLIADLTRLEAENTQLRAENEKLRSDMRYYTRTGW